VETGPGADTSSPASPPHPELHFLRRLVEPPRQISNADHHHGTLETDGFRGRRSLTVLTRTAVFLGPQTGVQFESFDIFQGQPPTTTLPISTFSDRVTPYYDVGVGGGDQTRLFDLQVSDVIRRVRAAGRGPTREETTTATCRQDMLETGKETIFYVRWRRRFRRPEIEQVVLHVVREQSQQHHAGDYPQEDDEQGDHELLAS
jgi:hypothetical protein